jgi:hypothetical protein
MEQGHRYSLQSQGPGPGSPSEAAFQAQSFGVPLTPPVPASPALPAPGNSPCPSCMGLRRLGVVLHVFKTTAASKTHPESELPLAHCMGCCPSRTDALPHFAPCSLPSIVASKALQHISPRSGTLDDTGEGRPLEVCSGGTWCLGASKWGVQSLPV